MDAVQLARWTRFAAKGGIGKCSATTDCIAQNKEDLMFLKGDEIVVLMRIPESDEVYLGFCEDVIGRFRGKDVRFHGKLKRPIITKRSSVSATKSPSPNVGQATPSPSRPTSLTRKDQSPSMSLNHSPIHAVPDPTSLPSTDDEGVNLPSISISVSSTPPDPIVVTPPRALSKVPRQSICSDLDHSTGNSPHLSSPPSQSPRIVVLNSPPASPPVVAPLQIIKKSPTSSPLHQSSFAAAQAQHINTRTSIPPSIPDNTFSTYDETRDDSHSDSDGEVGIGLSLLQTLANGSDSDGDSISERASVQYDDESTVEGLLYDDPIGEGSTPVCHQAAAPTPLVNIEHDFSYDQPQAATLPSRSSSPSSPTSPKSFPSLSPPAHQQHFSISSRRPSLQSSSSWEGAGDIYDDYRYSRASMISGASRARQSSVSSRVSAASHREAWDGYVYEQPPPIPDTRPSIDSIIANEALTKTPNDGPRRSVDSKKSTDTRKSTGSRKSSESEARRSRQELLFPQPPTNVNIQHELLDHATRESLRRSSEASRILTPADFRLSVESEASIYSRLSVIEQEPLGATEPVPALPPPNSSSPEPPTQIKMEPIQGHPRPAPLDLAQDRSPLLHATWASPMPSPSDSAFGSTSGASPTTSLLMPTVLTSLTTGMASVLRQKVETDKKPEDESQEQGHEEEGEETMRDIVVDDEEEIPSGVMQESTFNTEYSQDTTIDTSKDTVVLLDSVQATDRGAQNTRTPSPTSSLEKFDILGDLVTPPSPMVPSQPPGIEGHNASAPLDPPQPSTTPPAPASHLRPPRTLADLHEGRGAPTLGTGQRQSLFLPHPNAPKPPPAFSPGPMYLTSQQSSPNQIQQARGTAPKQSVFDVMRMALYAPPPPAIRPRMFSRGPTFYAQTDSDLGASTGPVPITFSVEPPPPQSVPHQPPSPQPLLHHTPPQQVPPQQAPSDAALMPPPVVPPASDTPVPTILVPDRSEAGSNVGSGAQEVNKQGEGGDVIPRANFFPKTPGARPRSRSFSAFNSHSTQLEVPLPMSREEGSQPTNTPTANDVRQSLRPRARSIVASSPSQNQASPSKSALKPSPLRPSHLKPGTGNAGPKSPTSPLAQSFGPLSTPLSPTGSVLNFPGFRPSQQLRQTASRSTLNDAVLSKPPLSVTNPDAPPSPPLTPRNLPRDSNLPPQDQPTSPPRSLPQGADPDQRSQLVSPTPAHNRQHSLRTKLSLPNLRRNRSRPEEGLTLASPIMENDVANTVQVQDLDFELVRPTLQFQNARSSEDSGVLGRETSLELPTRETNIQRAASPSGSLAGPKSPTSESLGPWPRPSMSSTAAPIVTRATADTELNMDAHRQRESKWMSLMGSIVPSQWRKNKKVKKLIHEGVPSSVRYLIWSHLTDGKAKVVPGVYFQLGNRDRIAAASVIDEDIKSCFQEQPHLQGKKGPVLALLQAYLTMVPDVQYTTGLTLIAGELLLHAPEEDAFWIFTSVMDTHLRPYFSSNSTQMEVDATLFSRVVENNDSQLAKKLYVDMGIEPSAVCAPWFSALFVSALPPEYVNRVWDLFLYEGIPLLFRVGFAVLTCCRRQILGATSSDVVLDYLQHPSPGWLPSTPEGFLSLAHSVKMKDDDMRKTRLKMEAQVKRQAQAQTPRHLPITTSISLPRS